MWASATCLHFLSFLCSLPHRPTLANPRQRTLVRIAPRLTGSPGTWDRYSSWGKRRRCRTAGRRDCAPPVTDSSCTLRKLALFISIPGRFKFDPTSQANQTGTIYKSCAFRFMEGHICQCCHVQKLHDCRLHESMREDGSCEAMALGKSKTVFFMCVCKGDMCNKGENHTNYREFLFGRRIFKVNQRKNPQCWRKRRSTLRN